MAFRSLSETSFFSKKKTGNQVNYGFCIHLYELKEAMTRNVGLVPSNKEELLCYMTETWGESTKAREGNPGHSQSHSPEFSEVVFNSY